MGIIGAPARCRPLQSAQLRRPQICVWLSGRLAERSPLSAAAETLGPPREVRSAPSKLCRCNRRVESFGKSAVGWGERGGGVARRVENQFAAYLMWASLAIYPAACLH